MYPCFRYWPVSCKSDTTKGKAGIDEAEKYVPYDSTARQIATTDTVVNNKGIQFELTFRGGSLMEQLRLK